MSETTVYVAYGTTLHHATAADPNAAETACGQRLDGPAVELHCSSRGAAAMTRQLSARGRVEACAHCFTGEDRS